MSVNFSPSDKSGIPSLSRSLLDKLSILGSKCSVVLGIFPLGAFLSPVSVALTLKTGFFSTYDLR